MAQEGAGRALGLDADSWGVALRGMSTSSKVDYDVRSVLMTNETRPTTGNIQPRQKLQKHQFGPLFPNQIEFCYLMIA